MGNKITKLEIDNSSQSSQVESGSANVDETTSKERFQPYAFRSRREDVPDGPVDTSGSITQIAKQSDAIDGILKSNDWIDVNALVNRIALNQNGIIYNLREYIQSKISDLSNVYSKILNNTGTYSEYVSDGQTIFPIRNLSNAIDNSAQNVIDKFGQSWDLDSVMDRLSDIMQVAKIQDEALASLQNASTLANSLSSDFIDGVRLKLGDLTANAAGYASFIKGVLNSQADIFDKLSNIFSQSIANSDIQQVNNLNTPAAEYTGVNPAVTWCAGIIENLPDIDLDSLASFAKSYFKAAITWPTNVFRMAKSVVNKVAPIVKNAVDTTFVNPIDIDYANDGYSFDKSIETCSITLAESFLLTDTYAALHDKIMNHFDWVESSTPGDVRPVNPEYLCIPTLGATYYILPDHMSTTSLNITCSIHCTRHLYYKASSMLDQLCNDGFAGTPGYDLFASEVGNWLGANIQYLYIQYPIASFTTREHEIYNDFLCSCALMMIGLDLYSGDYTKIRHTMRLYADSFNTDIAWLMPDSKLSDSSTLTNLKWIDTCSKWNGSADQTQSFINHLLSAINTGFVRSKTASCYVPYSWMTQQTPGSYIIKSDADNFRDFGAKMKKLAVVAAVAVGVVISYKVTKALKINAIAKIQNAQNTLKTGTAEEAYRANRVARMAAKLAGVSFVDITRFASDIFTLDDARKIISIGSAISDPTSGNAAISKEVAKVKQSVDSNVGISNNLTASVTEMNKTVDNISKLIK